MKQIVLLGGSGNLALLKLVPELYKLKDKNIQIIVYARSDLKDSYDKKLLEFYKEYSQEFLDSIVYLRGSYDDLTELSKVATDETVFYFTLPTSVFYNLAKKVREISKGKMVFEKPFGETFEDFSKLTEFDNTVFIDHYLAKPLSLAYPEIQKTTKFTDFLNNENVVSIQVLLTETILVGGISHFDKSGTIKDVVRNHAIEMLAVALADLTDLNTGEEYAKARAEVINKMKIDRKSLIKGQYEDYVVKGSKTETLVAFKATIDDKKWENVEVVFKAGKALPEKKSEVVFKIKKESIGNLKMLIEECEDFKEAELIFSFASEDCIYLNGVCMDGTEKRIEVVSWNTVHVIVETHFGGLSQYEYIFNALLYNKPIAMAYNSDVTAALNTFKTIEANQDEPEIYDQMSETLLNKY
ncbi:G6PD [Enterospora canceri]|uniref:Glucose-6-phosphate 1-dehydrogenase n=1 Tax=Enterospora canceri TaxID=1081671 RepID=A0A1Y1S5X7_9MICR|nr:G6PD [Enterospora canceri]